MVGAYSSVNSRSVARMPAIQCPMSGLNPCSPSPAMTAAAGVAAHRQVDVAAVALALVELRHEGQRLAVLLGDRLGAVLVDRVLVGRLEHLGVAERDLLLAEVALALDALAVHSRAVHRRARMSRSSGSSRPEASRS